MLCLMQSVQFSKYCFIDTVSIWYKDYAGLIYNRVDVSNKTIRCHVVSMLSYACSSV